MSNKLYDLAVNKILKNELAWKSGEVYRAYLLDLDAGTGYAPDFAADEFLADIPSDCLVDYVELIPATPAGRVCNAPNVSFLSALAGDPCEAIVIVKWETTAADSPLVAYVDTASSGIPITPDGNRIDVTWDTGAEKIFKL